mgnify:CR=1 FL=1
MIITVKKGIPEEEVKKLVHTFEERGFQVNDSQGTDYHILGLIGDTTSLDEKIIQANPLVSEVTRIAAPYKKANRMFHHSCRCGRSEDRRSGEDCCHRRAMFRGEQGTDL